MSTLRDALGKATVSLQDQISASAVKQLKTRTTEVSGRLKETYSEFFEILHERVLNAPGMNAADDASPAIFSNSGVPFKPWHGVTPRWFQAKEKAAKAGDSRALNFYHGVTESLTTAAFNRRNRKGKFRKKRSTLSFDQFIQSLAIGGDSVVQGFFGPMKVAYSIQRPDKGVVHLVELNDAIQVIRQWHPDTKRFVSAMDGTIIRTTITAFPKLKSGMDENSLIKYMINKSGHKEQWVKIAGGGRSDSHIRPILLPLINWYMKAQFIRLLEEEFR